MTTPNKLNTAKWVIALRSGRFKQTQSALKKVKGKIGYCCLGVACEISKLGVWATEDTAGGTQEYVTPASRSGAVLPFDVARWLGLESNPEVTPDTHAIGANDDFKLSFKQIADGIEKMYLGGKKARDVVANAKAEAAAWLTLAEEHDAGKSGSEFLCLNLMNAVGYEDAGYRSKGLAAIPADIRSQMVQRIKAAIGCEGPAYHDGDDNVENRQARVLACLMFAQQAADGEPVSAE